MGSGSTVEIHDTEAFPAKVTAIRDAIGEVRTFAGSLKEILDLATQESASFTRDGSSAPVYGPLINGLRAWLEAVGPAASSVCDSAENCAATAAEKFAHITDTDSRAADTITAT